METPKIVGSPYKKDPKKVSPNFGNPPQKSAPKEQCRACHSLNPKP